MHRIKLTVNIGSNDKTRLGLETPAVEGEVVEVAKAAAEILLKNGWGVIPSDEDEKKAKSGR